MPDNLLTNKLRLRAGMSAAFINPPNDSIESLDLPDGVVLTTAPDGQTEFIQVFARDSAELAHYPRMMLGRINFNCILWFCYPKVSSGISSDLTRIVINAGKVRQRFFRAHIL